jgi:hypothetical protein
MKIVNERILREFREKQRCEHCGADTRTGADPHHVAGRGHGGGNRMDVPINLVGLCRFCHTRLHNGVIPRKAMLEIVAEREGVLPEQVKAALDFISRLDGKLSPPQREAKIVELPAGVQDLVRSALE